MHDAVDIVGCGDFHPFSLGPVFPRAKTVFLRNCDKNFIYYWMQPHYFPYAKRIFLDSHPCEFPTVHRFAKQGTVYVRDGYYRQYLDRWWTKEDKHVKGLPEMFLKEELEKFDVYDL
jgi:hypothetical protein